jgi:serine acetyltransferase
LGTAIGTVGVKVAVGGGVAVGGRVSVGGGGSVGAAGVAVGKVVGDASTTGVGVGPLLGKLQAESTNINKKNRGKKRVFMGISSPCRYQLNNHLSS